MPIEIITMIGAFLIGIAFDYSQIGRKILFLLGKKDNYTNWRTGLYKITIVYLLFKIGFVGGGAISGQSWQTIIIPGIIVILAGSFWTLLVLLLLNRWSSFQPITQISIAVHFGSVSVGTFIAGMAFLDSLGIYVSPSVAIWLALMELPAIVIGIWQLRIRIKTIIPILKEEWALTILPMSILLGIFFEKYIPEGLELFVFGSLFMPILLYFLFEMGRNASDNIKKLKGKMGSIFAVGILIPILGGIFGISLGYWLGYDAGKMFTLAILMASASYVLAPLCMQELLKSIYKPKIAKQVVATSVALSVGVTLPFNILIGFELYYLIIKVIQTSPIFATIGLALPFIIGGISLLKSPRIN